MDDINKALEKKFLCSARFAQEIEGIVSKDKMSYIDAIIYYCEKNAMNWIVTGKQELLLKSLVDVIH